MTVGVLWGVSAQLGAAIVSGLFGRGPLARRPDPAPALLVALSAGAVGAAVAGELVRSGHQTARVGAVALGAGMAVAGAIALPSTLSDLAHGSPWPAVTTAILIGAGPAIAWRMTRPPSQRWFSRTTPAEARRRHDARWAAWTAAVAAPLGVLVAFSQARGR